MLRYFPQPYPDESMYHLYVRYDKRIGNNSVKDSKKELGGNSRSSVDSYFSGNLDYLCSNLPTESNFTPEYFIQNHTLLPIFQPFVPSDRLFAARKNLKNGSLQLAQQNLGYRKGLICKSHGIKVCSKCIEEDRQTYSEAYIHRVHQVQGVFMCCKHKVPLREVLFRKPMNYDLYDIEALWSEKETKEYEIPLYLVDEFYDLSCDVDFLIKNSELMGDLSIVRRKYKAKLYDAGFITPGGTGHYQDNLHEAFLQNYSGDFLRILESEVDTYNGRGWLMTLVRSSTFMLNPIRNLLFIKFLFGNLKNFVNYSKTEYEPFGSPPFPCLKEGTGHYGKKTISSCIIKKAHQEIIGVFECETCKFSYTLRVNDFNKTGFSNFRSRRKVIIVNGINLENTYKTALEKLIKEKPYLSRSEISRCLSKAYRWLRLNKREWIEQRLPISNRNEHKKMVDWIKRDEETSLLVKDAILKILTPDNNRRITINSIAERLNDFVLTKQQLAKLPITNELIMRSREDFPQFHKRKIDVVSEQFKRDNKKLVTRDILREAHISKALYHDYYDYVNNMIGEITKDIQILSKP